MLFKRLIAAVLKTEPLRIHPLGLLGVSAQNTASRLHDTAEVCVVAPSDWPASLAGSRSGQVREAAGGGVSSGQTGRHRSGGIASKQAYDTKQARYVTQDQCCESWAI